MVFKKYNKVHRLGKEETEGILDGKVLIQEKIDGANTSIWKEEGVLKFGTRNTMIESGFRGFVEYVYNNKEIQTFLDDYPHFRLYGEWLVKHTISYNELAYKHFYLYDIYNEELGEYLDPRDVANYADEYGIKRPRIFFHGVVDDIRKIESEFVGKTDLGSRGEGVVIKRHGYVSKFGDTPQYAKIVTQEFKEDNATIFGGNDKHSETYWEQYICNTFMTVTRVNKIIQKIESNEDKKVDISDTPKVVNMVYHDLLEEEIWTIQKKVKKVDFNNLKRICTKKAQQLFKDILNDSLGVSSDANF